MTGYVASLGMYDHPGQRRANDRLWAAMAGILRADGVAGVPDGLDRTRDVHALWRDPDLLFGQACGYPLIADPTLALRVLAFPVYDVPSCGEATHSSVLVARRDDRRAVLKAFQGARAAINDRQSNTGMNLFRAVIAPIAAGGRFFSVVTETGSHRGSVHAVAAGEADIAAIDSVTYAAIRRFEPALTAAMTIVGQTGASPTLPFVTAAATDSETVAALRTALRRVIADPCLAEVRSGLFLVDVIDGDQSRLAPIAAFRADAAEAGYAELR